MPSGTWNLEWLNHNGQRRYPLADDADGVDATGSFRLPADFIVELDLPVHAGLNVGPAGFFLRSVAAYGGGYGVTVGYQPADGSDPVTVATALVPRQGFVRNTPFALGGVGDFSDSVGKIVIGRLDGIDDQPPGMWEFGLDSARLDPDAVRPIVRGVASIVCVNGDQRSAPLYGDIELVAGNNMLIVPVVQAGQDPVIRFNAISGEGTVEACVCEGDAAPGPPIRTINGVAPTAAGEYRLVGSECVQVTPVANGAKVADTCSQPCCGCAELEKITRDLDRLGQQAATVADFVSRLAPAVDAMSTTVLGARLSDRGCVSCD